jgi:hypothetical protein
MGCYPSFNVDRFSIPKAMFFDTKNRPSLSMDTLANFLTLAKPVPNQATLN